MSATARHTLANLLFGNERRPPQAMIERLHEAATTQDMRQEIERQHKLLEWTGIWDGVVERLPEAFDIGLEDIFAGALRKARMLKKYCDRKQYPPDKVVSLPLGDIKLTSEHKPRLDIEAGNTTIGRIELQAKLEFRLKSSVLEIRDGIVQGIGTGKASVRARLMAGKLPIWEPDAFAFDLPGHLDLERGIALPWRTGDAIEPDNDSAPVAVEEDTGPDRRSRRPLLARLAFLATLLILIGMVLRGLGLFETLPIRSPESAPASFSLTIVTQPATALVRLVEPQQRYVPGMQLAPGSYRVEVSHDGYQPHTETIELREDDRTVQVTLQPVARVDDDGPVLTDDETPRVARPARPSPTVGRQPSGRTLDPAPSPSRPPAGPTTYAVTIDTSPPGAKITIKGVGRYTPGLRLKPGRYEVKLEKRGYQYQYEWITIEDEDLYKRFEMKENPFG